MPRVVLSARARLDLVRLYAFLAQLDSEIASEGIGAILSSFDGLHLPEIGAPVPEQKGLRKLVIEFGNSGYTALYRYSRTKNAIVVLAIKHQKENDYK